MLSLDKMTIELSGDSVDEFMREVLKYHLAILGEGPYSTHPEDVAALEEDIKALERTLAFFGG